MSSALCGVDVERTEKAWRLSQFALEIAAEAMFTFCPGGCILHANRTACERLEYSPEELVGKHISDIDPRYPADLWTQQFGELRRQGKMQIETQHRAKSGRILDVEVSAYYLEYDGTEYSCVSVRDITEWKLAQEELRQRHEELAHVGRLSTMGEMASSIAHELTQPLAALANYSFVLQRLLKSESLDVPRILQYSADIGQEALRAGDIIKSMRRLAQKAKPSQVKADLHATIGKAIHLLEPELRGNKICLYKLLRPDVPVVQVDRVQIQQVLVNLIRNAVDAMQSIPTEHRILKLTMDCNAADEIEIRVQDSGPGIAPGDAELVFEAFHTTKRQGMGLGLAISRSIAESHGGRLEVEHTTAGGAIFCLVLPTRKETHA